MNPICEHGGTCENIDGGFECKCTEVYTVLFCEEGSHIVTTGLIFKLNDSLNCLE